MDKQVKTASVSQSQEIPDNITTIDEFRSFVKSLKKSTIRKWSTKDWVQLYKLIDAVKFKAYGHFGKDKFMTACDKEIRKLYNNYRLEKKIAEKTEELAKKCGQYIALQGKAHMAKLFRISEDESKRQLQEIMDSFKDMGIVSGSIPIELKELEGGRGAFHFLSNSISISSKLLKDGEGGDINGNSIFSTTFHEFAHGGLQIGHVRIKNLFPEEFYSLCDYNNKYYYNSDKKREEKSKFHKFLNYVPAHNAYAHQPIEAHAFLFGYLCERAYREELKLNERLAVSVARTVGNPEDIVYQDDVVVFEYSPKKRRIINIVSKLLPQHVSVDTLDNGNLLLNVKCDYKSNRVFYALSNMNVLSSPMAKSAIEWMQRKNEKAVSFIKRHVKTALSIGMFIGGVGAGIGGKYAVEKISEDMQNNAINKEWIAEHADADSVFADAKNAHFYAHKMITGEEKAKYMKQIDELEQEYLKLAQDDRPLKNAAGNFKMKSAGTGIVNMISNKDTKWYKLSDGNYIADNRVSKVHRHIDDLRSKVQEGIKKEIVADVDFGYRLEYDFDNLAPLKAKLDEAVSANSIEKHSAEEFNRGGVVFMSSGLSYGAEIPEGYVNERCSGEQYKKRLAQKIAAKKQKDGGENSVEKNSDKKYKPFSSDYLLKTGKEKD